MLDSQSFLNDAQTRGLDTFSYQDPKTQAFLLVAGCPESIRLLGEILDDYELLCEVAETIDQVILKRWHQESQKPKITASIVTKANI